MKDEGDFHTVMIYTNLEVEGEGRFWQHSQLVSSIDKELLKACEREFLGFSCSQERDEEGGVSGKKHHCCEVWRKEHDTAGQHVGGHIAAWCPRTRSSTC